jgi:transposase
MSAPILALYKSALGVTLEGFTNHRRTGSRLETGSDAMPALPLRTDFNAKSCRLAARHAGDASQAWRLLSIAAIYDGASRGEAAVLGSVTVQIVCDWVKKFNAHGPEGLINRKPPGKPPKLTAEQLAALAAIVESGPIPASHGVVRWRIIDLCQWVHQRARSPGRDWPLYPVLQQQAPAYIA